jgi:tetratricopeptide (TPR) repeat protein
MHRPAIALVLTAALAAPVLAQSPPADVPLPRTEQRDHVRRQLGPGLGLDFGDPATPIPRAAPVRPGADAGENPDTALAPGKGDLPERAERGRTAAERREERLDRMFEQLAAADSKERADRIARHILRRLERSGSDTVDLLMERAEAAMQKEDYGLALDLLDGVVRMRPQFAEGWNRRATANFLAGNFGQSVADIEQTLRYEPRHWGALLGLSMILASMERNEEAVEIMDRAMAIHPFLEGVQDRRDRLAREVATDI